MRAAAGAQVPAWIVVAVAGYALLLAAWTAGTPPFHAPDEIAHMVRVYGLSQGDLLGERPPPITELPPDVAGNPTAEASYRWAHETSTLVRVPAALNPFTYTCDNGDPAVPVTCPDLPPPAAGPEQVLPTNTGTTNPLPQLLPAALIAQGDTPTSAVSWARVGQLIASVIALGVALMALRPLGRRAVTAVAVTATPMVLFTGAVLNPSGPEVLGAVVCLTCTWRMLRDPSPGWVVLAVLSAAVLPLTRQPGIAWALIALAAAWLLRDRAAGARRASRLGHRGGPLLVWGAALVVGTTLAAAWSAVTAVDVPTGVPPDLWAEISLVWRSLPVLLHTAVGSPGGLEWVVPGLVATSWQWLVGGLAVWAVGRTRGTRRLAVPLVVLGVFAAAVVFWAFSYRLTGFGLQGRHLLPGLVLIPLAAVIAAPLHRLAAIGLAAAATALHLTGWYLAARRVGGGTTAPIDFIGGAAWDPAGGWVPWVLVAVLGGVLVVVAAVLAPEEEGSRPATG